LHDTLPTGSDLAGLPFDAGEIRPQVARALQSPRSWDMAARRKRSTALTGSKTGPPEPLNSLTDPRQRTVD
jgi:hypothetical protein